MFKKIVLLICVAFAVVCYAFPCFVLPFGSYKGEIGSGESKVNVEMNFGFDGKVKIKTGELENSQYYKIEGDKIIISEDKTFDKNDVKVKLDSMYEMNFGTDLRNDIGMYMAIGVGALAVVFILLPSKRR